MIKIAVTGGSGFIGTNLVVELLKCNYNVLNLDIKEPPIKEHLPFFKKVDILDYKYLSETLINFQPDVIIHLAAITDLIGKELTYYKVNTEGTENIIKIAKALTELKRVIFTSSMYVCQPGLVPTDYDTYTAHTVYGQSKVQNELSIKAMGNVHFEWLIIRPSSIWGPWFETPYIDFFNTVYKKRYFAFNKACTKTYGYVGNTAFQIRKLVEAEKKDVQGGVFYLGDLPATNISEWADEISVAMGLGNIRHVSYAMLRGIAMVGDVLKKAHVKFPLNSFRLNNMVTNNVLPVEPVYKLAGEPPVTRKEGVVITLQWLKEHRGYNIK